MPSSYPEEWQADVPALLRAWRILEARELVLPEHWRRVKVRFAVRRMRTRPVEDRGGYAGTP